MTSHTTSRIPPTLADVHGLDLWQHAGLPAGGIVGPGGTPPGTLVWASGTLRVPGSGAYAVEATSLCGGGDLAAMFTGLSKVCVCEGGGGWMVCTRATYHTTCSTNSISVCAGYMHYAHTTCPEHHLL